MVYLTVGVAVVALVVGITLAVGHLRDLQRILRELDAATGSEYEPAALAEIADYQAFVRQAEAH